MIRSCCTITGLRRDGLGVVVCYKRCTIYSNYTIGIG